MATDVRFEAVLSSQIGGAQNTLEDVSYYEGGNLDSPKDVEEGPKYIAAMDSRSAMAMGRWIPSQASSMTERKNGFARPIQFGLE